MRKEDILDRLGWNTCYHYGWEVRTYWDKDFMGYNRSVYESFPDIDWNDREEEIGAGSQILAIDMKLADRPSKRFVEVPLLLDLDKQ